VALAAAIFLALIVIAIGLYDQSILFGGRAAASTLESGVNANDSTIGKDVVAFGKNVGQTGAELVSKAADAGKEVAQDYASGTAGESDSNNGISVRINIDNDRYEDSEDRQPLIKNSARVKVMTSDIVIHEDYAAIASPEAGNESDVAADVTLKLVVKNEGDDYTKFVKFDVVFLVDDVVVKKVAKEIGRLDDGQSRTMEMNYQLKITDIPAPAVSKILDNLDQGKSPMLTVNIKNLDYEKF
jgi:hypothetical protein